MRTIAKTIRAGDEIGLHWRGQRYLHSRVRLVVRHGDYGACWVHVDDGRTVLLGDRAEVTIYNNNTERTAA